MGHSILPKSWNEARMKENLDVLGWSIPQELFARLSEFEQEKMLKGDEYIHETFVVYKTLEDLWDDDL
ncbi:Aldo/keto reductase/potassium channel subunit beta [Parasponia andersonii]|uniref:Aldo/keto reductase/potassium channel subunit beta n=1 Tax=Parasponia andersonii TaxID=3476 RepID=A0A2P5CFT1_PARAD|nr:Aldo/keto reductase/potassium channel subunit beta [Parasponia andersonii]